MQSLKFAKPVKFVSQNAEILNLGLWQIVSLRFQPKLRIGCGRNTVDPPRSKRSLVVGSGCGAVGRAVASKTRGPGFESSHWQLLLNIYLLLTVEKTKNKEKEAENGPFF